MRLKSGIWVAAYLRRCRSAAAEAMLRRRGAEEAGAVFIKVARRDGTAAVFAPAPQTAFHEARPAARAARSPNTSGIGGHGRPLKGSRAS